VFERNSRYYGLPVRFLGDPTGRAIPYVSRRFAPQSQDLPLLMEATTVQGDRLDLIASRTLGDPQQYWRICDANNAMNPDDLTAMPGLRVPVPYPQQLADGAPLPSDLPGLDAQPHLPISGA
jgi:hypothetical protein